MCNKMLGALLIAFGVMAGQIAIAEETHEREILVSLSEKSTVQANVEEIDIAQRNILLALPNGQKLFFDHIDQKITHFDRLKVNDKVGVSSSQSSAIVLQKGGAGVRKIVDSQGRDITADGAGILKTQTFYNDILNVDLDAGNVTVKNVAGKIVTIPVENKALLMKAEAGDQLLIVSRVKLIIWGN
ncbi:hypothetical protein [Iodobacter ciconiae]|uniref:Uncharacterized protein n=1 Tax=Iodobacter ciconiae TaxID=2496266 RepID=A0A3S8ZSJ3_9NEIS|nr:hypothetical protein [Iodobacter ciconiae]AZN36439.1 hypothetical protein EJO50_08010 [Iodobacter ciconiae]